MLATSQAQPCFQFPLPPLRGRDRMGPCLLLRGCQGTAREVNHLGSCRVTPAGLGEEPGVQSVIHMARLTPLF